MKRIFLTGTTAGIALTLAACGGGDAGSEGGGETAPAPAPAPAPAAASGAASSADWVTVDEAARRVTINLVAAQDASNNSWNYNGHSRGSATVVVPQGFQVTINFRNADPVSVHSVAVMQAMGTYPGTFENATPVFQGAITSNATSMTEATATNGGTDSVTFTASTAGSYALVCLVPAHAISGMWIGFDVSATGESGVRM